MNLKKNEIAKIAAATKATTLIKSGMKVGLGTGSTASYFIKELAKLIALGLKIEAVATSVPSYELAKSLKIPMIDVNTITYLDVCVDGADEIDQQKQMIKGGGGALLREKIIACMSQEMIVIIDQSKVVDRLGSFAVPVEITNFANQVTIHKLKKFASSLYLRKNEDDSPFVTDNGNLIVDLKLKNSHSSLEKINSEMREIPGVLETGLFLKVAGRVVIGYEDGHSEILE